MRALIHALEHDRTDLETPAAPPEHLEGDVLACDDLRGLIDCLDESTILLQAADDVGIKTAIRIAVFKFRLASGTTAEWDDVPCHRVGHAFRSSLQGIHPTQQMAGKILRAIIETLEETNMAATHWLRTGPGGDDPQRARLQQQAREARTTASLLSSTNDLDPGEAQRLLNHPLPHWVERMTVSYLKAHGGQAEKKHQSWNLTWPDGETYENVVFTGKEAERLPAARHLTLEEPKVRGLAMRLPRFAPGQQLPIVSIPGLSAEIRGTWSLWRIAVTTMEWNRRRIMPLFLADNGVAYLPTARHVWDQLLAAKMQVRSILDATASQASFTKLQNAAEEQGKPVYEALVQEHRARIAREREKADYAFAARRRTVEQIGLPQVRNHRLSLLAQEERSFQEQLEQKARAYPEMVPLLVIRVEGSGHE